MKTFLLLLCLFTPVPILAQTMPGDAKWTRILGPGKDFSIAIPPGSLVYNERDRVRFFASSEGAHMTLTIIRGIDSFWNLRTLRSGYQFTRAKVSPFKVGGFEGDAITIDGQNFTMHFYIASKKAFYSLTVSAESLTNSVMRKLLDSILLDGLPITEQKSPAVNPDPGTPLFSMKTSLGITAALTRNNPGKIKIEYADAAEPQSGTSFDKDLSTTSGETRPLIILQKPRANFTSDARYAGTRGTVRLKVLLKAEGYVGAIKVMTRLPNGLTSSAIDAAKQIKFLPREVAGKPVDAAATFDYGFH